MSLKDEHESQGEARGSQGHKQHACPVVPQGEHLAMSLLIRTLVLLDQGHIIMTDLTTFL